MHKGIEVGKQQSGKPQVVWGGWRTECLKEKAGVETAGMGRAKS